MIDIGTLLSGLAIGMSIGTIVVTIWWAQTLKQHYEEIRSHHEDIRKHYIQIGAQAQMLKMQAAVDTQIGEHRPIVLN